MHPKLGGPGGEDALDVLLPQAEEVIMPRWKVADIQESVAEAQSHPMQLSLGEEPISDAALIEDLDGARVQTAGTRSDKILAGSPFKDGSVDPRQLQLGRQHQTGRASSRDHH
jgi:hypothetical protein